MAFEFLNDMNLNKLYFLPMTFAWIFACISLPTEATGQTIVLGSKPEWQRLDAAARSLRDGDILFLPNLSYKGETAVISANNVTISGPSNAQAVLDADGKAAQGKAILVVTGSNTTIENLTFQNAKVGDKNGAGIRLEGNHLTVKNCRFIGNENGILSGKTPESIIHIENSEFASNGHGDGQSHNIYIGHAAKLTLIGNYIHGARVGHQIKSRAKENFILYNRIADELAGNSSYLIDIPDGGVALVLGNVMQQGKHAINHALVSYGTRYGTYNENGLYVIHNTMINERGASAIFVSNKGKSQNAVVANNLFFGEGRLLAGHGNVSNNHRTYRDIFEDKQNLNVSPTASDGIKDKAIEIQLPTIVTTPTLEYRHPHQTQLRKIRGAKADIGAYEINH